MLEAMKRARSVGARRPRLATLLGLTLTTVMLLGGCGQKGPLKLPPPASQVA
jgi:hypothetical protein